MHTQLVSKQNWGEKLKKLVGISCCILIFFVENSVAFDRTWVSIDEIWYLKYYDEVEDQTFYVQCSEDNKFCMYIFLQNGQPIELIVMVSQRFGRSHWNASYEDSLFWSEESGKITFQHEFMLVNVATPRFVPSAATPVIPRITTRVRVVDHIKAKYQYNVWITDQTQLKIVLEQLLTSKNSLFRIKTTNGNLHDVKISESEKEIVNNVLNLWLNGNYQDELIEK